MSSAEEAFPSGFRARGVGKIDGSNQSAPLGTVVDPADAGSLAGDSGGGESPLYTFPFWLAYAANWLAVTVFGLHVRFADFVSFLGGTAGTTGIIWGLGTLAALLARVWVGWRVDRTGYQRPWLWAAAAFLLSSAGFVCIKSLGMAIIALRMVFSVALAGMFCCALAHVWRGIPASRRPEAVGVLGTSGFLGTLCGPALADALFHLPWSDVDRYRLLFGVSAALAAVHLWVVWTATRSCRSSTPCQQTASEESLWQVLLRHWPLPLVPVAFVMGGAQVVTFTFLASYLASRHIPVAGGFFLLYAGWALVLRVIGRRAPEHWGLERSMLLGVVLHAMAAWGLLQVHGSAELLAIALAGGTAHAIVFPCMTTAGAASFPGRYPITGVAVTLSMVDVGNFLAAPLLGQLIDWGGYEEMLATFAGLALLCSATFAFLHRGVIFGTGLRQLSGGGFRGSTRRRQVRYLPAWRHREDADNP
jgi:predicted MFS family arabinose efflux permease